MRAMGPLAWTLNLESSYTCCLPSQTKGPYFQLHPNKETTVKAHTSNQALTSTVASSMTAKLVEADEVRALPKATPPLHKGREQTMMFCLAWAFPVSHASEATLEKLQVSRLAHCQGIRPLHLVTRNLHGGSPTRPTDLFVHVLY